MTLGHGGDIRALASAAGCREEDLLDFSANINPLGPPDSLRQVISRELARVVHYPDPECRDLRVAAGDLLGISPERIVFGNGSSELLFALPRVLPVTRAVIPVPSYIDYTTAAQRAGLAVTHLPLLPDCFTPDWGKIEASLQGNEMVILGQPGNPTGAMVERAPLLALAKRHPATCFVVDEAFADFVQGYRSLACEQAGNIIVLRSMTKFYAIPGLRLGYAAASEETARRIFGALPPWSVGSLAQAAGIAALQDKPYAERTRCEVKTLREDLAAGLLSLGGLTVFPSEANYLLVRTEVNPDAGEIFDQLLSRKIAIRRCDNYEGLGPDYFRVAVRPREENRRLLEALSDILDTPKPISFHKPRRVPAVMFQGTSSDAGKSVLSAAFCRILLQDGFQPSPFKAQNMSLNSFVTRDGGEMGRAQVVQAQACRKDPDVRMNPVLLKPSSDTGSQVILLGKPVDTMEVNAYIRYKSTAFETIKEAYTSLSSEADVMVIEGAGSPGEVNLKRHDIVNMAMAQYAEAPVLLVGDIDRGGVFASFIGTLEVLSEAERNMVAGFVVNRFRGKPDLLGDAFDYVKRHTGLPTFGVIPFIHNLGLPEEDSVSFKALAANASSLRPIDIALVDLPHISNFTDFDPLRLEPDAALRIIRKAEQLGTPDAVILPGSKAVASDLDFLKKSGLFAAIQEYRAKGGMIVGVCGGMQMLGEHIEDPHHIESDGTPRPGLALLPLRTILRKEKTLSAASARHVASGLTLRGYEIHHGETFGGAPALIREDGAVIGVASTDGRVFGAYLHGLYDNDAYRRWFIDELRKKQGLSPLGEIQAIFDLEPALNRLADVVREHLDVKGIYQRMGIA